MSFGQQPPLFAPQPQHPIPPLRSPPPANSYASSPYPQQPAYNAYPQQGGGYGANSQGYGGGNVPGAAYWNTPTAQMGFQVGQSAVLAGQEYVQKNVDRWISVSTIRHYFNVSNLYVVRKLLLVLFPWRHHPWTRQVARDAAGNLAGYAPPREDVNSPDMYIPLMAFATYVLLSSLTAGLNGVFQPDILGRTAAYSLSLLLTEIVIVRLGCYLLNISSAFFIDLVAYSGYKFIGVIVNDLVALVGVGSGVWWTSFFYTSISVAFFMLRSLRSAILQGTEDNMGRGGKARRIYFLAGIAFAQLLWMYLLTLV